MTLTDFLKERGVFSTIIEGYSQQNDEQVKDLIGLTGGSVINVMEIGFNAGHSAEVFLENNKNIHLTSFDIGFHRYGQIAKEYIDTTYPGRHSLILGDSRKTVPLYNQKFDVIFIDGGHEYDVAHSDVINCKRLSHADTIVMLDDTVFSPELQQHWTVGPTKVWEESCHGLIKELGRREYAMGRGMSWGKYV
jgi:predicted O-methyltransferase YrrM